MIFAEGAPPVPVEIAGWLACLAFGMWMFKTGQDIWRSSQPMPPMEKQLKELGLQLMARLETQDREADARIAKLREHFDEEVSRVHQRIDAQGRELYRLDGYVRGSHEARREQK